MIALPVGVLAIGLTAYLKLTGIGNPINRSVTDYFGRPEPLSPYKTNWAQVNVLVPVPYVGANYMGSPIPFPFA